MNNYTDSQYAFSNVHVFAQQWKNRGNSPPPSEEEGEGEIHVGCVEGGGIGRETAGARVR